jgi:hypothetical protein
MNCNDYKEAIAAEPSEAFDGGAAHASECESCRSYGEEMRRLDDKIAQALSIKVPDFKMPELPVIEADTNVVNLPFGRKARMTMPSWIGLAASFAIAAVFAARILGGGTEYSSLAEEVVAHLDHEPRALRVLTTPVSTRTLNNVVGSDVADLGGVGLITYARTCPINGKQGPHLVIRGAKGPITLLLMPDEEIEGPVTLTGEGIKGVIIPVGHGSIAIIGDRDEILESYQQQVIDSVRWST